MKFYLGTHMANWLSETDVPLFVSHRRLAPRRSLPRALGSWALDSGGFTELSMHGRWVTSPEAYIEATRRYRDEIGGMDWAAPQDWMCEPVMLAKTGLSVEGHQGRTVENYLLLRELAPDLPYVPVLQGWSLDDYLACADRYERAGVDLASLPTVGIGSVCRRQSEGEIDTITGALADRGIQLHGFGVKTLGLRLYAHNLASCDSMGWSYNARRNPPMAGHSHKSCANCLPWALRWRRRAMAAADECQPTLWSSTR